MSSESDKKNYTLLRLHFRRIGAFTVGLLLILGLGIQVVRLVRVLNFVQIPFNIVPPYVVSRTTAPVVPEPKGSEDGVSKLLFVGDIMLDRGVKSKIKQNSAGYDFPFLYVTDVFDDYDIVSANLEGPISDRGALVGSKYSFRFDPEVAQSLANVGIDVVSSANNHIWDYGRQALCDTITYLEQVNVASVGAGCDAERANQPWYKETGDTSIMIAAYVPIYPEGLIAKEDIPGVSDYRDFQELEEQITAFRKEHGKGLVIVQLHWGTEYQTRSHESQQKLAHALIDSGVDLVIGHHPHVTQEVEQYKGGLIFYSLGNFIFDQYFSEETMKGFAAEVTVRGGEITKYAILPYFLNENYQPIFLDHVK